MSYLKKALEVVSRLEREKEKKLSEERRKTLDMCMTATILTIRDQIIASGKWRPSEATHAAEKEIEILQHEILEGRGKLIDFRVACEKWKKAGV
jgi:hypothetical protein